MLVIPFRATLRSALRVLFLACCAAVMPVSADNITFDFPETYSHTNPWTGAYYINLTFKCYLGCPNTTGIQYRINTNTVSAATTWKYTNQQNNVVFPVATIPGSGNGPYKYTSVVKTFIFTLEEKNGAAAWTTVDTQEIKITLKADTVNYNPSGNPSILFPSKIVVVTLKSGGPSAGKTRVDNATLPANLPPADQGELSDLFSYVPDYSNGVASTATNIPVGVRNLNIPVGGAWQRIRTNTGVTGSSGWPSWLGNGDTTARNSIGSGRGFFWSPELPKASGDPPVLNSFNWGTGAGGGAWASAGPAGNTLDMAFPKGYVPKEVDLRHPAAPNNGSLDVDPCFAAALSENGGLPPGMGPDPGTPPDGVTPGGEVPLPTSPGTLPGIEPGTVLPPGVTPPAGGGGGGSDGGGVSTPGGGGGGGGGGVVIGPPPPVAPEGKAPAEPGEGLPGDSAANAHADGLAGKLRNAATSVQNALEGLIGRGKVTPPTFGQPGDWTFSFQLGGREYVTTIPTTHAPVIRALLLFTITVFFLIGCYNLLAGK